MPGRGLSPWACVRERVSMSETLTLTHLGAALALATCVAGGAGLGLRGFWLRLQKPVNDDENRHYFYCFPIGRLAQCPKGNSQ